ncbi:hypothetical protein JHK84_050504 [Glycine max]|nr:hypothetical protein JHK84_050504 [Glycine max]
MEHETFLATWLAEIDSSPNGLQKGQFVAPCPINQNCPTGGAFSYLRVTFGPCFPMSLSPEA